MKTRCDMVTVFVARKTHDKYEFLQLRRCAGDYMGGTWQTVRGLIEGDETASHAALRELREETSLTPIEFYGLSSIDSFYTNVHQTIWHCPVFFAVVSGEIVLNDEHDDVRWVAEGAIDQSFMWSRERELIREIIRDILGNGLSRSHLRLPL